MDGEIYFNRKPILTNTTSQLIETLEKLLPLEYKL